MDSSIPDELRERADRACKRCVATAALLAKRGERAEWWERGITIANNAVGLCALLTVSVVPFSTSIAAYAKDAISLLAAVFLVGGPYFQMAILKDPSSRYRDYALYIGSYADQIEAIISDVKSSRRYERLLEVLTLAEKNMTDVRVKWPALAAAAEGQLAMAGRRSQPT